MLDQISIPQLRANFKGAILSPQDAGYDGARKVFSGAIDRRPAVILRPTDAADVAAAVRLARETGQELAIRGGGHSPAGHSVSEDGIVVDLRDMRSLQIDPAARTAWAETGLTAGEYTARAGAHGLATPFGDTSSVGIGGLTLGGGVGYLVRKYGLTIDSLRAAEIVTADGELLHADPGTHPDLFWAIRGGGGNFGVATRFKFRLHPVDTVLGGMLVLPATPDVVADLVAEAAAAPDELSVILNVMPAPPMPFLPPEQHGRMIAMAFLVYAGAVADGEWVVGRLRGLAQPVVDMVRPMRYPEIFMPDEEGYHPTAIYHGMFVDHIDRSVAATILERLQASTAAMRVAQLRVLGGAVARVPADATAYAHRDARIMVTLAAFYNGEEDRAVEQAWLADFARALDQGNPSVYVNFLGDEGEARVRAAYPGSIWERLTAVKARYDPDNLFRLNQNIPPA